MLSNTKEKESHPQSDGTPNIFTRAQHPAFN